MLFFCLFCLESLINFTIARVRTIPERKALYGSAEGVVERASSSSFVYYFNKLICLSSSRVFSTAAIIKPPAWSRLCGDLLGKIVDVNIVQGVC